MAMRKGRAKRAAGFTLIELLVVIAIIAVLVGMLVPAVQQIREAASKTECSNNMKQLGLALLHYHTTYKGFPPGQYNLPGGGSVNWAPYILPYIEQENLFKKYNFSVDWANKANDSGINQTQILVFICPSAPSGRTAANQRGVLDYPAINQIHRPNSFATAPGTLYAPPKGLPPSDPTNIGVLAKNTAGKPMVRRRVNEIKDGSSNTLLLAEDAGRNQCWELDEQKGTLGEDGAWANPGGAINVSGFNPATGTIPGPVAVNGTNSQNVYGFHPGGANGLFADGSVRFLSDKTGIDILIALTTRSSREVVPDGSY
jgi:prepilin-type N-terminal cleavage/methylation domain-containing protein/prepilin-type processing-associated H-X9-DG protein